MKEATRVNMIDEEVNIVASEAAKAAEERRENGTKDGRVDGRWRRRVGRHTRL